MLQFLREPFFTPLRDSMKPPARALMACLFAALLAAVPSCRPGGGDIVRTADGVSVDFDDMVKDLASVPLVFVGELHDRSSHHEAQLAIIKALAEQDRPLAVGLEMFHDGHQGELDEWLAGERSTEEFLGTW